MKTTRPAARFSATVCLLLVAAECGAQSPSTAEPLFRVLPDSVRLILSPALSQRTVAISVMVRMPEDETPLDNATGALVAKSLFNGSQNTPREMAESAISEVGGDIETLRLPDRVCITCVTLPALLPDAIHLICESIKNAEFAPDALARARRAASTGSASPAGSFDDAYDASATRLKGGTIPDASWLRHVDTRAARAYFLQRYVPSRTVIAVAGRFDTETVERRISDELVDFTRTPPRYPGLGISTSWTAGDLPLRRISATSPSSFAMIGVPAPASGTGDYPAFLVLASLLADGHASRLFVSVRERLGLAYEAGELFRSERGDPLVLYVGLASRKDSGERADQALKLIDRELDLISTTAPSAEETARARQVAITRCLERHERSRDRAFLLAWYESAGPGASYDNLLLKQIAQVRPEDIVHTAHRYLGTRSRVQALPLAPR